MSVITEQATRKTERGVSAPSVRKFLLALHTQQIGPFEGKKAS
jgi:hypothetical protein